MGLGSVWRRSVADLGREYLIEAWTDAYVYSHHALLCIWNGTGFLALFVWSNHTMLFYLYAVPTRMAVDVTFVTQVIDTLIA
uniref:Uncharacterized protein n=1 Tax=Leersia perrieri TaxID=77586 RepID=A0A0D9WY34_9ORYZ